LKWFFFEEQEDFRFFEKSDPLFVAIFFAAAKPLQKRISTSIGARSSIVFLYI
jgi:hypothetical protein